MFKWPGDRSLLTVRASIVDQIPSTDINQFVPFDTLSYEEFEALTETEYMQMLQKFLDSATTVAEHCLPKLSKSASRKRFWCTLVQNNTRTSEQVEQETRIPTDKYATYYKAFTRSLAIERHSKSSEPLVPTMPLRRQLRNVLGSVVKWVGSTQFKSSMFVSELAVNKGMAFVLTGEKRIGWVNAKCQAGDAVAVILGLSTPFVVGRRGEHFQLVGNCYVDGIMYGEVFRGNKRYEAEDLTLC